MTDRETLNRLLLARTPKPKKEKTFMKRVSDKMAAKRKAEREVGSNSETDKYFEYHMKHSKPVCQECGMEAYWLLEPQQDEKKQAAYKLMWRACQAHILPKKKTYGFPSISGNLDNHMVLFPSWGGHLCGCHGFYDSNWYNASTMKIWTEVVQIIKEKLYPKIAESEKKNIPEQLLLTLKN